MFGNYVYIVYEHFENYFVKYNVLIPGTLPGVAYCLNTLNSYWISHLTELMIKENLLIWNNKNTYCETL